MKKIIPVIIIAIFFACQSSPKSEKYNCSECYVSADCLYRMKSAKNATICAALIEACRDAMREKRCIERLKYCRKNKPDGMTERECLLFLNQK